MTCRGVFFHHLTSSSWCIVDWDRTLTNRGSFKDQLNQLLNQLRVWTPMVTCQCIKCTTTSKGYVARLVKACLWLLGSLSWKIVYWRVLENLLLRKQLHLIKKTLFLLIQKLFQNYIQFSTYKSSCAPSNWSYCIGSLICY